LLWFHGQDTLAEVLKRKSADVGMQGAWDTAIPNTNTNNKSAADADAASSAGAGAKKTAAGQVQCQAAGRDAPLNVEHLR